MYISTSAQGHLEQIFLDVTKSDALSQQDAAHGLRDYVRSRGSSLDPSSLEDWEEEIGKRILSLTQSNVPNQKLGAIRVIDVMLDLVEEDPISNRKSIFRFYNYLSTILRETLENNVLVAASKSLGKLTEISDLALGDRFVEEQIPNFLEMILHDARSPYGAVLALKELARNSPSAFFPHLQSTFASISPLLGNPELNVRRAAAQLIGVILAVMRVREFERHSTVIKDLYLRIQQGLQAKSSVAVLHGSLLALQELFPYSRNFLEDNFLDTWNIVQTFRAHPNSHVRDAVLELIPILARHDPKAFNDQGLLDQAMSFLLPRLDANDASTAYITVGHLSSAVGARLRRFMDVFFSHVRKSLQLHHRRDGRHSDYVFKAIGLLSASLGSDIAQAVSQQLDLMFSCDLSESLIAMFESIVQHIPILLKPIQDRLLDMLSLVLSGNPYRPLGTPQYTLEIETGPVIESRRSKRALALDVLGRFNFEGHVLNELAVTAVLPHLEDEDAPTRKSATITLCRLLARDPVRFQGSHHSMIIVSNMLDKLLTVGIVDADSEVRKTVLASLETSLDRQLAQAEYIRLLTIALHDEVVENRILAVQVIGRLATQNPAQVAPPLRKTLVRLLAELRHTLTPHNKEHAIRILAALVSSTHVVVEHYVSEILEVLLQCASENNLAITGHALHCIGQLSSASPPDVVLHIPRIMSIILAFLEADNRSTRLTAALGCLGQLCTNCAYVITPIEEYPELIPLLHGLLRREHSVSIRHQVIRVIGLLGVMDPGRVVHIQGIIDMEHPPEEINAIVAEESQKTSPTAAQDDLYQDVVIDLLVEIFQQPAFSSHRHLAVDSLMSIAKTRGTAFAKVVPKVMPAFGRIIRTSVPSLQSYYLAQLTVLVGAIKQHSRICVTDIMELVHDIWDVSSQYLTLVVLVETLADALASEFAPYVSRLLPRLLRLLQDSRSDVLFGIQIKVLKALVAIGSNLQQYLNLVVPAVVMTYEKAHAPQILRRQAIESLADLSGSLDLYPYTSRIVHSLMTVITAPEEDLRHAVLDALRTIAYRLGSSFVLFVPMVVKSLESNSIDAPELLSVSHCLLRGETLPPLQRDPKMAELQPAGASLSPNQHLLKQAWDVSRVQDRRESWLDWFIHLAAQLIKESTSIPLRSCMNLFDAYPHVSARLFNPAFASCWSILTDANKDDLIRSIEHVISASSVPAEVAHSMLELIEYMERSSTKLPISNSSLAEYCFQHRAYAKALHYQELHFFQDPSPKTIEALIETNAMLRQEDAALGTLNLARQSYTVENQGEWYEKLGQWNEALHMYEAEQESPGGRSAPSIGKLRCLHGLGEWEQLAALTSTLWPSGGNQLRYELAPLGAAASWNMGDWKSLNEYCSMMRSDSPDRAFYRAVSEIHRNHLSRAIPKILVARDLLDPQMTAFLDEDPDRLSRFTLRAQMISELEEIVLYKESADQPGRRITMQGTWKKRLLGCQRDLDIWQRVLKVRTLAVRPEEDIETVVRFANLCRKSGRLGAAQRAMQELVHPGENGDKAPPEVVYAQLKMLWASGDRETAFTSLHNFTQEIARDPNAKKSMSEMLARCHLKYGNWRSEIDGGITTRNAGTILLSHRQATKQDPKWSKAWHTWALSNLEMIRSSSHNSQDALPAMSRSSYIIAAMEGLFQSIHLMNRDKLQDTLRLLTLWFKFGAQPEVTATMLKGFKIVACDTWLDVVPQIIARIQIPTPLLRDTLTGFLVDIGHEHPQALLYPLTVAAKSPSKPRKAAAIDILDRMCAHSAVLVEQAKLVGQELTRVAITWGELWHEALQASARYYFNGKPEAMLVALQPLYEELDKGPSTLHEKEFSETLGPLLLEARELCRRHLSKGDQKAYDKAWSIHLRVWQHLEKHFPDILSSTRQRKTKSLDLHYVSSQLLRAIDLELAMPGTYRSGRPVVKISSFKRDIPVLGTKQHPRRLVIVGNDGKQYAFLLKGREDLRQDERVMQVIGLVNKLLSRERESLNRRLHLQRYPVIPLAPDVGLIGWMDGTDTLHSLISEYRKANSILIDLEYRMMLQDEPDYENTTLARKIEVFESALERTTGQDLYRILWLKSESSEAWVTRRSTYTRSLAVGNMIGYLLGVGDRHPANIMLGRQTGKVIHIDFGDCFEVALLRDKLPEKIPFRLTRMLRNAMEVCGIQGGFKTACEISMTVLRDNKESLLAVLEALVYDPLINWRLVKHDIQSEPEVSSSLGSTDAGPARRTMMNEEEILGETDSKGAKREVRNDRALRVYNRVEDKLTGRDFEPNRVLSVPEQIERLVQEAVSTENLCELFHGWSPFW